MVDKFYHKFAKHKNHNWLILKSNNILIITKYLNKFKPKKKNYIKEDFNKDLSFYIIC
jgi:hypothetical protein